MPTPPCGWGSDLNRARRHLCCAVLFGGAGARAWAADPRVWLVQSGRDGPYAEVAAVLREELTQAPRRAELVVLPWQDVPRASAVPPAVCVTAGVAALHTVLERWRPDPIWAAVPLVATLLPQASYQRLVPRPSSTVSGVWLDQPLDRYLTLLQQVWPERRKVGVLWGPESQASRSALHKAAVARGMVLVGAAVEEGAGGGIHAALIQVLAEAEVLLALPDNLVYNQGTLQHILTTAYRQRIPMLSFSAAMVKAGATLALYATPGQVAWQAAGLAQTALGGRPLGPARPTDAFSIAVNDQVLRSLGLRVPDVQALSAAIRQQEGAR